ncbi:hypothetical protein MLD38_035518 [Melastoma candidum]|uniref:Uncharacterized protein n=1 Tax=Melastoma candidum TaxID=119954 RepID=A0ACB9LGD4_9MYRT|nr:hypothetical protein MLD38_035518 [Melastoma candidum]
MTKSGLFVGLGIFLPSDINSRRQRALASYGHHGRRRSTREIGRPRPVGTNRRVVLRGHGDVLRGDPSRPYAGVPPPSAFFFQSLHVPEILGRRRVFRCIRRLLLPPLDPPRRWELGFGRAAEFVGYQGRSFSGGRRWCSLFP